MSALPLALVDTNNVSAAAVAFLMNVSTRNSVVPTLSTPNLIAWAKASSCVLEATQELILEL